MGVIIFQPSWPKEKPIHTESPGYDHITATITDRSENVCSLRFDDYLYEVDVRYFDNTEENENLAGQWIASEKRILLSNTMGLDIDTVAHEVAHTVQTLMRMPEITDPHYGPYIQGRLTRCIWEIVQEDMQPRFRFAD
jgi:hypothetical protein